jgi:putative membrane-bound dehydrogenase-like protein
MRNRELRRLLLALLVLPSAPLFAQPLALPDTGFERTPPLEPEAAVVSFRVPAGFRMELVAAEPLLVDPVDVVYDPEGRAYAVEMRGYPLPEKPEQPRPEPISRVRMLFDDNGDGRFDRSTVFVDRLDWPTAVCLWKDGVFVADAPDLWFCRDINGDGVADERRKVLTGFKQDNVQALVNNLKWGLDHRIYGAASGNGGTLTVVNRPDHPAVAVTRRDFRFDPVTETVEAISGGARFGHSFDDFGNRFLCNIRNPVQHVVLPLAPLARNPQLAAPSPLHDVAASGDTLPVHRISPVEAWREFRARRWVQERSNLPGASWSVRDFSRHRAA